MAPPAMFQRTPDAAPARDRLPAPPSTRQRIRHSRSGRPTRLAILLLAGESNLHASDARRQEMPTQNQA